MKRIITATYSNKKQEAMRGNVAVKQYLLDNGFRVIGSCNCGGSYTIKMQYDITIGEVLMHVRGSSFLMKRPGQTTFIKYPIGEIKIKVDEVKRDYEAFVAAPKA